MASAEQIAELRRKISEPDDVAPYTDVALGVMIDEASGDVNYVAGNIWEEKGSLYAEMTDITEAGSSRKNSQLYKNALEMAAWYRRVDGVPDPEVAGVDYPTTTKIVRPV